MTKKVLFAIIGIVSVLTALSFFILNKNTVYQSTGFAMDTVIDIKLKGNNAKETSAKIVSTLQAFENDNSMYIEDSDISKINTKAGKEFVPVNEATYQLLRRAYTLCEQSNGKFDITVGPLIKLWDISGDNPRIPVVDDKILSLINYKDIQFNDNEKSVMLKHQGQLIDLGGIAKGSASDVVYKLLQEENVEEGVLSLGGNVIVYGDKTYNVGIKHPRKTDGIIATVSLSNTIISTTGDYERYFEVDGKRYHHIMDPKIGQPYNSDFYSVTVISNDGTLNDYLSTTLFMTPKSELIGLLDTYQIIAFGKDNKVYASANLNVEILDNSFTLYEK